MILVEEARTRILAGCPPLPAEETGLDDALGRVLAAPVRAALTQPPADLSAMDGYAVRAADAVAGAELTVIGAAPAGAPFAGSLGAGQAVRIFTGGVVPAGADAIVIQEDTEKTSDGVRITETARPGRHIRRAGFDFSAGADLLPAGRRLSPADLGLAAAANAASLRVGRRPRVAIFATGDELVPPGARPAPGQIVSSSPAALSALILQAGGIPDPRGIIPDDPAALAAALARANDADIIVTLGGASVGDHDHVRATPGLALDFWKIAMRPGKPLIFGHYRERPFFGLPGNPAAGFVCAVLFLCPAILAAQGAAHTRPQEIFTFLGKDLPENDKRQDYLRIRLSQNENGDLTAHPLPVQDSSMVSALSAADGLLVRPSLAPAAKAGQKVPVILLRPFPA